MLRLSRDCRSEFGDSKAGFKIIKVKNIMRKMENLVDIYFSK